MIADPRVAKPMALAELARRVDAAAIDGPPGVGDPVVLDLAYDSRQVAEGSLFVCLRGGSSDGHAHAATAVASGAVAVVAERPLGTGVPELVVPDTRAALAQLSAAFFGYPAAGLTTVGVTGTNGKTTVTALIAAIADAAGRPAATIGTLTGGYSTPTTPEAPDLQRRLAQLRHEGADVVAIEVSSHALALRRVDAMVFDVAVFTNLSRDHLDFHGSMDAYFQAKASLFEPGRCATAVVNVDDPYGRLLLDAAQVPTVGFSVTDLEVIDLTAAGSRIRWDGIELEVTLPGRLNLANALAAATTARELGIDRADIAAGLAAARPVRGRFERVPIDAPYAVVVDYAHTPDALERLLESARELADHASIHLVFGCGGDKDRTKRAPMGEVAARLADHVVLTSDNPRSEDPAAIIAEVRRGMASTDAVEIEPDRRAAIAMALRRAGPGDVVLVAGKGHETTQVIGSDVVPFDDREVVVEEHRRLGGAVS